MESKFKKNILSYTMILFGVVIATLLLAKYFKEKGIKIDSTASTIKDETIATEKSYWDKFIEFFGENNILPTDYDWLTTTTGKFLETYLGNYTNFIIWALLVLAIWWLVFTIFELLTGLKGYRKVEYGISGWLFFLVLLGAFILAITNANKDSETKVAKSSFVDVRMNHIKFGEYREVSMNLITIAKLWLPMSRKGDGVTTTRVCAEIIEPAWITEHKDTPKFHIGYMNESGESRTYQRNTAVLEDMRKFLIINNVDRIKVRYTLFEVEYNSPNKCPHSTV